MAIHSSSNPSVFQEKMQNFTQNLNNMFEESKNLEKQILEQLERLNYD